MTTKLRPPSTAFEPTEAQLAAIEQARAMDPVRLARWGGVKVTKADAEFGFSRSAMYVLIRRGLPSTLAGKHRCVPRRALAMVFAAGTQFSRRADPRQNIATR